MVAGYRGRWIDSLYEAQKSTQGTEDCALALRCTTNPSDPFEDISGLYRFTRAIADNVVNEAREHSAMGLPVTQQLAVFDVAVQQFLKFLAVHDLSPGHGMAIRDSDNRSSFA